ncbi:PQQ-binding-like beta-propeller repeat protein [Haloprofundus halobius]|uniref:outer membrane protein assembly factor BamB family protein n=1 Tax=Haloprofundus halobius TaxID=2876194 RepID=UPI001CCB1A45|nr:PQQ-binding-like beta-propeller repeat protein [Haloprofundus halobius]
MTKALATHDGTERWTAEVSDSTPTPGFATGHLFVSERQELIALNAHTGTKCWRTSLRDYPRSKATDSDILVVNVGTDGLLIALDAETGALRWERMCRRSSTRIRTTSTTQSEEGPLPAGVTYLYRIGEKTHDFSRGRMSPIRSEGD